MYTYSHIRATSLSHSIAAPALRNIGAQGTTIRVAHFSETILTSQLCTYSYIRVTSLPNKTDARGWRNTDSVAMHSATHAQH